MKKTLLFLLLCLPLLATAKEKIDDSKYLKGAVPEVNGIVTFQKSFKVPGKNKQQIHDVLQPWVKEMADKSISAPGPYGRIMQDTNDTIAARVVEWLTFKDKFLNLDQARFRYQINVIISDGRVNIIATSMAYQYGADPVTEQGGVLYRAEEWISDEAAVNKKGTKLYPKSAKFRRKTVDRMESLFESAMDAFEPKKVEEPTAKPKKIRTGVVED